MQLADWTSIAIIILAVEAFIFVLVFGALFLVLNIGVVKAQGVVKHHGPIIRSRLRQVASMSEQASQKLTGPIISVETTNAKTRQLFSSLRSSNRK
jgi:inner membrane protein involved in colicin E2 resistance